MCLRPTRGKEKYLPFPLKDENCLDFNGHVKLKGRKPGKGSDHISIDGTFSFCFFFFKVEIKDILKCRKRNCLAYACQKLSLLFL